MSRVPRRSLLKGALAGVAWSGAASAQGDKPTIQGTAVTSLVSRRMDEMTSREIELYLKAGGDLVLIPFGPVSGHGALIPVGMHAHWAHALSILIAEKANGLGITRRATTAIAAMRGSSSRAAPTWTSPSRYCTSRPRLSSPA